MRRFKVIGPIILLVVVGALCLAQWRQPAGGCALRPSGRAFARLKNRTDVPGTADFDEHATLAALLAPGADSARWSNERAARLEGYVIEVNDGAIEASNCYSFLSRDTHITLALRPGASSREHVILEVTPKMRERALGQGMDWSTGTLKRELKGRRCRFEGWLLFDEEHAGESENTAPGRASNWRATAWELHPVTTVKVVQ